MADWRANLNTFFEQADQDEQKKELPPFARFIRDVAVPAYQELKGEMERHGRQVTIRESDSSATISVSQAGAEEITYRLQERLFVDRTLPYAEIRVRERKGLRLITVESMLRSGQPDYALEDITSDEIIRNFLQHYMTRVKPR